MEIIKRNAAKNAMAGELEFLYDEIIVYYETDGRSYEGFHLDKNPFLKKLQVQLGFELIDDMKKAQEGQPNIFYFKKSKDTKIESWFFHLRNAIAHNRVFKVPQKGCIILEDVNSNQLSMYAEISSFAKLKEIITEIKNNYKQ